MKAPRPGSSEWVKPEIEIDREVSVMLAGRMDQQVSPRIPVDDLRILLTSPSRIEEALFHAADSRAGSMINAAFQNRVTRPS